MQHRALSEFEEIKKGKHSFYWGCALKNNNNNNQNPPSKKHGRTLQQRDTGGRTNQPQRRNRKAWNQVDILIVTLRHMQQILGRSWGLSFTERDVLFLIQVQGSQKNLSLSRRSLALSNTRWGSVTPVASADLLNDLGAGDTASNKDLYIIHNCTWNSARPPRHGYVNLLLCFICFPWSNGELTWTGKRETVLHKEQPRT